MRALRAMVPHETDEKSDYDGYSGLELQRFRPARHDGYDRRYKQYQPADRRHHGQSKPADNHTGPCVAPSGDSNHYAASRTSFFLHQWSFPDDSLDRWPARSIVQNRMRCSLCHILYWHMRSRVPRHRPWRHRSFRRSDRSRSARRSRLRRRDGIPALHGLREKLHSRKPDDIFDNLQHRL